MTRVCQCVKKDGTLCTYKVKKGFHCGIHKKTSKNEFLQMITECPDFTSILLQGGGGGIDLIFISGIPNAGKSTVSAKFVEDGYHLISLDQVIDDKLIPMYQEEIMEYFDGNQGMMFGIYHPDKNHPVLVDARKKFIQIVKKMIKEQHTKGQKVIIEGTVLNEDILRGIFGGNENFKFYFVVPFDKNTYIERFRTRFIEDPDNYGRFGTLRRLDADGKALTDFKKNGLKGKIINDLIEKVANEKYDNAREWIEHYTKWGLDINYYSN